MSLVAVEVMVGGVAAEEVIVMVVAQEVDVVTVNKSSTTYFIKFLNFDMEESLNRKKIFLISFFALVILIVASIFYYLYYVKISDYVIPDVPYFGIYSGTLLETDTQTSVAMVMRYWGDNRLGLRQIAEELPYGKIPIESVEAFFKKYRYDTEVYNYKKIKDFSRFINSKVNIPLIVPHRLTNRTDVPYASIHSVLIGISGSNKELVFHDNIYGNNYRISFAEFEKSLKDTSQPRFLVVRPSAEISNQLKPIRTNNPYPVRKGVMDSSEDIDLEIRWAAIRTAATRVEENQKNLELLRDSWKTIINHPAFSRIHPAGKVMAYSELAGYERKLKNYEEAIRIIEELALPLNHDLNKAYGDWDRDSTVYQESIRPWLTLERTYVEIGNLEKAKDALDRAASINPDNPLVREDTKQLDDLLKGKK